MPLRSMGDERSERAGVVAQQHGVRAHRVEQFLEPLLHSHYGSPGRLGTPAAAPFQQGCSEAFQPIQPNGMSTDLDHTIGSSGCFGIPTQSRHRSGSGQGFGGPWVQGDGTVRGGGTELHRVRGKIDQHARSAFTGKFLQYRQQGLHVTG